LTSSRDVWLYPESKSERIAAEPTVGGFVRCSEGQDIGESLPFCPSFFVLGERDAAGALPLHPVGGLLSENVPDRKFASQIICTPQEL